MATYIEYDLGDGAIILIEGPIENESGVVRTTRGGDELTKVRAKKSFADALKDVRAQAKLLLAEIEELHVNEAEIKFGINTVGELGNMAIGRIGVGVNYEVTLKWTKPATKPRSKIRK
jgi:hypothetical protein